MFTTFCHILSRTLLVCYFRFKTFVGHAISVETRWSPIWYFSFTNSFKPNFVSSGIYPECQRYQYSLRHETPTETREEPLVQTVEFFGNAGPMGCRFMFPESHFDPKASDWSQPGAHFPSFKLVLTSTMIGLDQGQPIKHIILTCFQFSGRDNASHSQCGYNRNVSNCTFPGSRHWSQSKFRGWLLFTLKRDVYVFPTGFGK